jgi:hypothetical protein
LSILVWGAAWERSVRTSTLRVLQAEEHPSRCENHRECV